MLSPLGRPARRTSRRLVVALVAAQPVAARSVHPSIPAVDPGRAFDAAALGEAQAAQAGADAGALAGADGLAGVAQGLD